MIRPSTATSDATDDQPSTIRALSFGVLTGLAVALVYGVLTEPIELTLGLLAIGFFGGWLIGAAVAYGAWSGREHQGVRRLQVTAAVIAIVAWFVAVFLAFAISQAFIPQASTTLAERVNLSGFLDYFGGLDDGVRFIHVLALALMAFMAWRGQR